MFTEPTESHKLMSNRNMPNVKNYNNEIMKNYGAYIFLPDFTLGAKFANQMRIAGDSILKQCLEIGRCQPDFAVVDFAITKDAQGLRPKLIEMQSFMSWVGAMLTYKCDSKSSSCLGNFSELDIAILKKVIGKNGKKIAVVDHEPESQSTYIDLIALSNLLGADLLDASLDLNKIKTYDTVVNRVLPNDRDEDYIQRYKEALKGKKVFNEPDEVNLIDKKMIPFLKSSFVPKTEFITPKLLIPEDLTKFVIKPTDGHSGQGVNLSPTVKDIREIGSHEENVWLLQEKVEYASFIFDEIYPSALYGECRMHYIKVGEKYHLLGTGVRLSRKQCIGKQFDGYLGAAKII